MKRIDPHVHCRDGKEAYKATIREVSELAKKEGICHICDMPSATSPILREKDVIARLELAKKRKPATGYSFFVSLTGQGQQIKEAVRLVNQYQEVAGLKLFPPVNEKRIVYRILAEEGYQGVLAVHAEKFSLFKPQLFDPRRPWTHNLAQPSKAEIESVKEQIKFAREANFQGVLYICHITLPESAEIIWLAKKSLNIYAEATPHHLLLSEQDMRGERGLLLKVNPPLRDRRDARGLLQALKEGFIDCISTDYAPHALLEKIFSPYLSGIASYRLYGMLLDILREEIGLPEKEIDNLTYWNIKKIFGKKLESA